MTKILVIDWGLIGDVINHSMVYSSLKQKYPDSRIVLITKPYNYELFKNNPHIDKIFILEKKTHKSLSGQYGFFNNIKLYITVLFTKFDLCIDFYNNKNSMFITFLSFANKKMGFFKKKLLNKIVYNQTVKPEELSYKIYNLAEGIMKKLKLNCGTLKPELYFSNENLSDADKFFFNKTKFQIGIFVGASIESRRWDLENVKRLIFGLKDKNIQFYILSGPLENESVKQECLKISEEVPYYFDMNILELSSFISKLDLLVTNDSGPLHIAKAVNTDFIGLFGPTHHEVAVIGENSAYLSGYTKCNVLKRIENDRNPCEYKNCESKECIKSITPEQVSEKVMEYYNKKYSSE